MPSPAYPRGYWLVALAAAALALAACVSLRDAAQPPPSFSINRPAETTLGKAFAADQARHPGRSGLRLINSGISALMTRAALADLAEHEIDLQYFIFEPDQSGAFLIDRLVAAAERGVRVRILLDGYALAFDDVALGRLLDAHPNIEIRVFNPLVSRTRLLRGLELALNLDKLGMRMHNKLFVADSQVAILGGRNISNRYFEAPGEANFRDLDVLAAGPIAADLGKEFDEYWNSPISFPVTAFATPAAPGAGAEYMAELRALLKGGQGPHVEYARRQAELRKRLLAGGAELSWAPARAVTEAPVRDPPDPARSARVVSAVTRTLAQMREATRSEMVMVMAYYVPGSRGVELAAELVRRGVRVRILTNSLATTDVTAVYAGYSRYRRDLLASGVELYEYRPEAPRPARAGHAMREGRSDSALHTKLIVYDRRWVWIGSANSDPRSRTLNTETGLLIDSEEFARRVLAAAEQDFSPEHSWRLTLDGGEIAWNGSKAEPAAGLLRSLGVWFYSLIPGLEGLL